MTVRSLPPLPSGPGRTLAIGLAVLFVIGLLLGLMLPMRGAHGIGPHETGPPPAATALR
ncbi:hypothetical protein [Rhodoplanes roseus]|uniref:hypothetical protein n=1 Tax=Rhodoplanes roseus TaxID=29409 RepID=UPI0014765445|nr:hypothetical protein [Rhodoplanes roseus]